MIKPFRLGHIHFIVVLRIIYALAANDAESDDKTVLAEAICILSLL